VAFTILWIIRIFFQILIYVFLAVAIMSWFVPMLRNKPDSLLLKIYYFLYRVTEPLTRPARALLRRFNTGPMDFSIFLTVLFLIIIQQVLIRLLIVVML
jgi:uncharacterized protein YggT (Ycf19 family)